jgi:hypothetical protein
VFFDPWQAQHLVDGLRRRGVKCQNVPQTHSTRGPKDTELYEMAVNQELVLYDDPELVNAVNYANAKELGNGLLFIQKAGRGKIDLLIALSNCANEARNRGIIWTGGAKASKELVRRSRWNLSGKQRIKSRWSRSLDYWVLCLYQAA